MQQQPFNGGVRAGIGWNPNDEVGIWIALPASCFIEIAGDGEPSSGGWMTPGMARELAFALLLQAAQIENGVKPAPLPDSYKPVAGAS
jgi:hypothetical protein